RVAVVSADPADAGAFRTAGAVKGPYLVDEHLPAGGRSANYDGDLGDALVALGNVGTAGAAVAPLGVVEEAIGAGDFVRVDAVLALVIVATDDDRAAAAPEAVATAIKAGKRDPPAIAIAAVYPLGAPRLDAFVAQFPHRAVAVSVDAASYTPALEP